MTSLVDATLEELGRELARRAEAFAASAEASYKQACNSSDVLEVALAAESSGLAAHHANECMGAVIALLGTGDTVLLKHVIAEARNARTHQAMAERRWLQLKNTRGNAHA